MVMVKPEQANGRCHRGHIESPIIFDRFASPSLPLRRADAAVSGTGKGSMASAFVEAIGVLAAVLTTLCLVPQALKIAREREARAISLPSTMLSVLGVLLWLIYGVAIADVPLIGSSAVTFAITATILALKIRHG
jgi:MtN3 and saliva related transmembrane protein